MRWTVVVAALVGGGVTVALGACGSSSGGGDSGKDGGPVQIVGYPQVVSMSPANGDDNVSVHDPITVTFSEPVKLGANPLTLVGPGSAAIGARVVLSSDGTTVTIIPAQGLVAPTKLSVTWGDITSVASGQKAAQPAWSWSVPLWLKVGGNGVPGNNIGFAGSIVAAGPGERISVFSSDKTTVSVQSIDSRAGAWTALGPLNSGSNSLNAPHLIIGNDGAPVVSFIDGNSGNGRIQRWSGNAWLDVGNQLSSDADIYGITHPPTVVKDSAGTLFVSYGEVASDKKGRYFRVSSYQNGGWSQVGGVASGPTEVASLAYAGLTLSPTGTPWVYYEDDPDLYVRTLSSQNAWVQVGPTVNTSNEHPSGGVGFAIDDQNRPFVMGCFDAARVRRYDGSNWVNLGPAMPGGCDIFNVLLVRTQSGHLFAIWGTNSGGANQPGAKYAADITSDGWTLVDLPVDKSIPNGTLSLTTDPNSNPVFAWGGADGNTYVARLNR